MLAKRLELLAEFAEKFYPLTHLSMVTGEFDENRYGWSEGPMPWEGACI
ncbi:MAG: spore coat protein CotJB [Bacteroidaceae bacterium]|nr:spore coat protein CotJB [Bacteroidaceae bacterium]